MNNSNNNQRFDDMMYAYFGRGQESFEHRGPEHKHNNLRLSSAIAAALILLSCLSLVGYSLLKPKNQLAPGICAADITADRSLEGGYYYYSDDTLYQSVSDILGIINCYADKDIVHIKVRSLNGDGSFFRLSSSRYNANNPSIAIYPEEAKRHLLSEAFGFYCWNPDVDWTSTSIIGYCNPEKTDDKIEVVVYLNDDTYYVRYIDVTYDTSKPIEEQLTMTLVDVN